jgi:uncharacterized protein (TIGR02145 family)
MKKRLILINLISLIAIVLVVFQGCKKDEKEPINQPPTCSISSPISAQQITKGETVTISVIATDTDGVISEVQFYVDDVKVGTVVSSPYNFEWNTSDESIGNHILKATCFDNDNASASDQIDVVVFEEAITITDTRDGQKYIIVEIGNQTWFAENLNYETADSWWYDDSESNGEIYGRLYTWDAAQIACPEGWKLPSDDDWKVIEMQLGMSEADANEELYRGTNEGDKMKSISGWNNNGNGTNSSEFNVLPGGYYGTGYSSIGDIAGLWTSSESSNSHNSAWERGLDSNSSKVLRFDPSKTFRLSVRCLKN